ncbi:MAG: hypothetical protein CSA62_06370 [Planctomycetota bacterium]|nr:MAG: hypothetical protein CSA62_06370 [Planctomycetota bacterium]
MTTHRASWLNGRVQRGEEELFSAFDPALLLGDGLFESLAVSLEAMPGLELHESRLRWAAARMHFVLEDGPNWGAVITQLLELAELEAGRARISLLGPAERPRLLFTVQELPEDLEEKRREGIRLWVSSFRMSPNDPVAGLKCLSRSFQLAAEREARGHGADDALLLGQHGELRECTRWNVFAQNPDDSLVTPTLTGAFLPGITRARLLALLPGLGLSCRERTLNFDELRPEMALFLSNAVYGLVPVRELNGEELTRPRGLDRLLQGLLS